MEIRDLDGLDDELNKLWRLGRSAIIGWSLTETDIEVLAVPQFLLSSLLSNREDILADTAEMTREELYKVSDLCEIEPYRLNCPELLHRKAEIVRVVRRYSVSLKKDKGVILLDTVGFSQNAPLDQVTLLNSLSYSINIANKRALACGLNVSLEHSTTGDGFYVWNRLDGFEANVDLYCVMMLILADNAIAREKSMEGKVPVLRACFHVGNCYEYFQARGERPSENSYIVGDATIDAARMIDRALAGQILIGNFICPTGERRRSDGVGSVNTPEFVEIVAARLRVFEDVVLSRDTIKSLVCHLTGDRAEGGGFNLTRFVIDDKHGFKHEVFNAKINIHRSRSASVFLGLQHGDLDAFSCIARTATQFTPYGNLSEGADEEADTGQRQPPRVLVVDDEAMVRDLLCDWLHEAGYASLKAENAVAARDMLDDYPDIRAIVTDVMLPGDMSGLDLAAYVAALGRHIKVILVSGYSPETMLGQVDNELSDVPFLMKPLDIDEFQAVMHAQVKTMDATGSTAQ